MQLQRGNRKNTLKDVLIMRLEEPHMQLQRLDVLTIRLEELGDISTLRLEEHLTSCLNYEIRRPLLVGTGKKNTGRMSQLVRELNF